MNKLLRIQLRQGIASIRGLYRLWYQSRVSRAIYQRLIALIHEARVFRLQDSLKACGQNVSLQFPIYIAQPEQVEIGNDVSFAAFVHIWGGGGVNIGNRVMIASHTAITSITHDYTKVIMYGTVVVKPVVIQDDVWIGSHSIILPGITIGSGAVIGAGSVITKDVPPLAIVAGVPGKILQFRTIQETIE